MYLFHQYCVHVVKQSLTKSSKTDVRRVRYRSQKRLDGSSNNHKHCRFDMFDRQNIPEDGL